MTKAKNRGVGTGPAGPAVAGPIFAKKGRFILSKGVISAGDARILTVLKA